ncbi:unnamed protein product [Amoebophrya sp. A120]|nr:unnamed protein product [Amoebophrya sp. A120]|eukprot:GSA120T00003816001.1
MSKSQKIPTFGRKTTTTPYEDDANAAGASSSGNATRPGNKNAQNKIVEERLAALKDLWNRQTRKSWTGLAKGVLRYRFEDNVNGKTTAGVPEVLILQGQRKINVGESLAVEEALHLAERDNLAVFEVKRDDEQHQDKAYALHRVSLQKLYSLVCASIGLDSYVVYGRLRRAGYIISSSPNQGNAKAASKELHAAGEKKSRASTGSSEVVQSKKMGQAGSGAILEAEKKAGPCSRDERGDTATAAESKRANPEAGGKKAKAPDQGIGVEEAFVTLLSTSLAERAKRELEGINKLKQENGADINTKTARTSLSEQNEHNVNPRNPAPAPQFPLYFVPEPIVLTDAIPEIPPEFVDRREDSAPLPSAHSPSASSRKRIREEHETHDVVQQKDHYFSARPVAGKPKHWTVSQANQGKKRLSESRRPLVIRDGHAAFDIELSGSDNPTYVALSNNGEVNCLEALPVDFGI